MTALSVNLNKMALIRNSRPGGAPDLARMAERCLVAGAEGVTIHPRPDQRHARYTDAAELRAVCDRFPGKELNVEGHPSGQFLDVVIASKAEQCTLVPDSPGQATSDHGWDTVRDGASLVPLVARLHAAGIRVSLFLEAESEAVRASVQTGVDRIELYTASYAHAYGTADQAASLAQFVGAAELAQSLGLGVNAGHDLSLVNVRALCRSAPILEVSIGHALTVECFDFGLEGTIARYLDQLRG
jgi:pyridoxine 5-phosphate synthase